MAGTSAFKWGPAAAGAQVEGRLSCRHGETVGHYTPGGIPGTPGQAARRMLHTHQEAYGCACTREGWTYYLPGGAGWGDPDDPAPDEDELVQDVPTRDDPARPAVAPRWRYRHVIAGADTDRTEKELERLGATGWEVVTMAIVAGRLEHDSADFVYLLRQPVDDDA